MFEIQLIGGPEDGAVLNIPCLDLSRRVLIKAKRKPFSVIEPFDFSRSNFTTADYNLMFSKGKPCRNISGQYLYEFVRCNDFL